MKKYYNSPVTKIIAVTTPQMICTSVRSVQNSVGLSYEGGGSGEALSRKQDGWEEEEE